MYRVVITEIQPPKIMRKVVKLESWWIKLSALCECFLQKKVDFATKSVKIDYRMLMGNNIEDVNLNFLEYDLCTSTCIRAGFLDEELYQMWSLCLYKISASVCVSCVFQLSSVFI